MATRTQLLTGVGLGFGLMYLLDPQRGTRRRARVRDAAVGAAHELGNATGKASRDAANRISGTAAELRARLQRDEADDHTVAERVRARLGRLVSHPHAITVSVSDGIATLSGPVLKAEVPRLLNGVQRIRGVRDVVNELEEHKHASGNAALQGGAGEPAGRRPDLLQRTWAPATRVLAAAAGMSIAAAGAQRRDTPGLLLVMAGMGLLARAATNLETRRLVGLGPERRAVDLQKTIAIGAPVEQVYRFWSAYENFPRFMSRVHNVRPSSRRGQSHWTVTGPGGAPVDFDVEITQQVDNEILAWRTIPGSLIGHAGIVRFDPTPDGGTRVHIRMSYNPPGGWFGHGVARVFGVDPKSSLDADLVRMKTLIETGRAPHDAAHPDPHWSPGAP